MSPGEPKPRTVVVDGRTFERIPVRTRVLMPGDDIIALTLIGNEPQLLQCLVGNL